MADYYDKSGVLITPETVRRAGSGCWIESEGRFAWPYCEDGTKIMFSDFTDQERDWYYENEKRFPCRQKGYVAGSSTRNTRNTELTSTLTIRMFLVSAECCELEKRTLLFANMLTLHVGAFVITLADVRKLIALLYNTATSETFEAMLKWSKQNHFNFATVAELNEFLEMARGE